MEIVLIGLSHRTASVELRERVAFSSEQAREAAEQLRSRGILEETMVLSTCNRSELYGVPGELSSDTAAAVELFLSSFHQMSPSELGGSLYRHRDSHAVRHLFRVAAGLDSMLLGEAEILGQVRDAYQIALDHGETGPVLNRMFQGALEIGKRVRTETEIGTRPVSVAFAGVKLTERIFGKLNNHRARLPRANMARSIKGRVRIGSALEIDVTIRSGHSSAAVKFSQGTTSPPNRAAKSAACSAVRLTTRNCLMPRSHKCRTTCSLVAPAPTISAR